MTIVSLDRLLRGGRCVGSRGGKSPLGEFARICHRRRSRDSFRNRPHGPPILFYLKGNEGMSEGHWSIFGRPSARVLLWCATIAMTRSTCSARSATHVVPARQSSCPPSIPRR